MKKFILGFITGGIICAAVTGLAVEYAVTANPYPVKVNGVETAIEGYNINDETYFKLRDVSAAVGGFEVGFEDNIITVNTKTVPAPTVAPTSVPTSNVIKPTLDPNKEYGSYENFFEYKRDDGLSVYNIDGKYYLNCIDIDMYTDFDCHKFDNNYLLDYNEYVPFVLIDYYNNTVLVNSNNYKKD